MGNVKIVTLDEVLSAEEEWRATYEMINLLEKEILRQLGNFDDTSFTSLKVIQELVSTAKSIAKGQWKGIHLLLKMQATGIIREH